MDRMFSPGFILGLFVGLFVIILLIKMLNVAQQYERAVIFTLGRVTGVKGPGLFLLIPFIQRRVMCDLRIDQTPIPPQEAITRDSVSIKVSAVVWYKVVDPVKSCVEIEDYASAVIALAQTNLRILIGQNNLDVILKDQQRIAEEMKVTLDKTTEKWGVDVTAVEINNIEIPKTMERSMAAEAEAQREKSARLIKAQGELQASKILAEAADTMAAHPVALELRRLQTMTEIGAEQNSMIILAMPQEFIQAASAVTKLVKP